MIDAREPAPSDENEGRFPAAPAAIDVRADCVPHGPFGRHDDARAEAESVGFGLRELLRILNKRKLLIASIVMASLTIGFVRVLMQTPLYTATVRLQIDRSVAKVVESGNVTPVEAGGFDGYDFLKTQFELLRSHSLAERVVSMTGLANNTKASESGSSPSRQADRVREAAGALLAALVVRPVPGSRLVDVSYSDPDPALAQKIATAFGEAFIASSLDKRFEANAYAKTFLDDQLKQLKLRLEESEKALLAFAEKEQIVVTTDRTSIAESNLAAANVAQGLIITERIKNEEQWRQVENATAINLPQLLTNKVIDDLRAKRNQLVTEYREQSETFRADYPTMTQISNKIKEIDRQLAVEVKTIRSSLKAAYEASAAQESEMKERIRILRGEVLDLQKRSVRYDMLKREVDTNRSLYEGLLQRFKEVDVAGGVGANNVFIIDTAELPRSPSSPAMPRTLAYSLAIGLALGFAAAYMLERLDDVVHSLDEAETATGLVTLGVIPKVRPSDSVENELADPRSELAEAYRSLCTSLQFSTAMGLPKTLLVTSAMPGEGKSVTSFAIAKHFAVLGLKVLVIDGDLRNGSLHAKLGLANSIGLSSYLAGGVGPREIIQQTDVANLLFLSSGPSPRSAGDLLHGPRLLPLLSQAAEVFDLVVIDGPPVMGLADAPILSNAATATIFLIAAGETSSGAARNALRRMKITRGLIIGAIITKFDARADGYGYGYYTDGRGNRERRRHKIRHALKRGRRRLEKLLQLAK